MTGIDPAALTSAPAVEALRKHFYTSITPRDARDALAEVAAALTTAAPSLPTGGGDGRHRLKISLDAGSVVSELICPESGCEPVDGEGPPAPCWLRTWAENEDLAANYVHETVQLGTFVIEAEFKHDAPVVTIVGPASSPAGDEASFETAIEKPAPAGDETRGVLERAVRNALFDPGEYTPRNFEPVDWDPNQTTPEELFLWQTRAALIALERLGVSFTSLSADTKEARG